MIQQPDTRPDCQHCGDKCFTLVQRGDKDFCCTGCATVYDLLHEAGLESYYLQEDDGRPGIKGVDTSSLGGDFDYLDDSETRAELLMLDTPNAASIVLLLPAIHCSACLYLLENLSGLLSGVKECRVDFLNKKATILYNPQELKLSELARFLTKLGYRPDISLDKGEEVEKKQKNKRLNTLYLKIGVAFFCFGNIMMLALPEYLDNGGGLDESILSFISDIQLFLGIPLLYSLSGYLKSAWASIRSKQINLDVPISIGVVALFFRSVYEILSATGPGYMDSLAGLAFFLLIGRLFQEKTYQGLSFSRDHAAFFPLSATRIAKDSEESISVKKIAEGDFLFFRNGEILPVECTQLESSASIDYAFVTGESVPVTTMKGDRLFVGGKVKGKGIRVVAASAFNQAYLNSLWTKSGNKAIDKDGTGLSKLSDNVSKWFTLVLLIIATISFVVWYQIAPRSAFSIVAAILIVACPCALALTLPFTYGTVMRLLGKHGLYLKSDNEIERMADIDTVIFDKTGTLTKSARAFKGDSIKGVQGSVSKGERKNNASLKLIADKDIKERSVLAKSDILNMILQTAKQSNHPVSRTIVDLTDDMLNNSPATEQLENSETRPVKTNSNYKLFYTIESTGKGVEGRFNLENEGEYSLKIGSGEFTSKPSMHSESPDTDYPSSVHGVGVSRVVDEKSDENRTFITLNNQLIGYLEKNSIWREKLPELFHRMTKSGFSLFILSGDNDSDAKFLKSAGIARENMKFGMSPEGKAEYINQLKSLQNRSILMAGDGLNDIGALSAAHVGLAVTEDTANFTPSSDGILLGSRIDLVHKSLLLSQKARKTVYISMGVSFLYNIVGLSFAISGNLTPVAAAILMPVSSITVVALTVGKSVIDSKVLTK